MTTRLMFAGMILLNLAHPFIHGTPLDGGMLDGLLSWLNTRATMPVDEKA